jgi:succinate-semialdehyde dehydrogenase/glutarate-semialdehyde dehydrogenase
MLHGDADKIGMYTSINPATGKKSGHFETIDETELSRRLDLAQSTFRDWRETSFAHRAQHLTRLAAALEEEKDDLARLMAEEMGKPVGGAVAEIEKCAWLCKYYADEGASFLQREVVETDGSESYVTYQPLGPILAIMPWNFPFWQLFRVAAPGLMAGNVILLKHAPNVPQCALRLERLFRTAWFPEGAFQNLFATNEQVARAISDEAVAAVTLTGSVGAGRSVAGTAGTSIKKCVLELGGSDPFVVLNDADLDLAVRSAVLSRTLNNGQSCIAAKRFILERGIAEKFASSFVEAMSKLRIGDPMDPDVAIGPLARADLRDTLADQVDRSVAAGAKVLLGGKAEDGPGYYYPPTVLENVSPGMPAFDEELFGPVAALIEAGDADEALKLANQTRFGLGAAVFTRDQGLIALFANGLEAGNVFVNGLVKSDPRLPFGGIKESGFGRELGRWGIQEFVNVKTVWIK